MSILFQIIISSRAYLLELKILFNFVCSYYIYKLQYTLAYNQDAYTGYTYNLLFVPNKLVQTLTTNDVISSIY